MVYPRIVVFSLFVLAVAAPFPASAQSVVSTHSGVLYFFDGSVFIGNERLEQRFGKFPDIGEGRDLRTEHGRAEVLLTPGVFLRLDENSSIRMLSNKLSDTRVELLSGSAIVESGQAAPDTAVKLIYKDWQVWVPEHGVYRIDSEPAQVQVYKGEVKVSKTGDPAKLAVNVKEDEEVPLAAVLAPDPSVTVGDTFKNWAMSRSQAISADNAVAADITDDPTQTDVAGLTLGGFTYFPMTSYPALGVNTPYGLSFWSPYQTTLMSSCLQPYGMYGPYPGWPSGVCSYPTTAIFTAWPGTGLRLGGIGGIGSIGGIGRIGGIGLRPPYRPAPIKTLPPPAYHVPAPHVAAPIGAHR
jgi:FecR protein